MKTTEFLDLKHFTVHKSQALIPATPETREWLELKKHNESVNVKLSEARDIKFHGGYFAILKFIYQRLNVSFKKKVSEKHFYKWLQMLNNEFTVIYEFKDGRQFIEYESISFAKMNQERFKMYVNEQLSVIYEELLIPMGQGYIMEEAAAEFERYLDRLI